MVSGLIAGNMPWKVVVTSFSGLLSSGKLFSTSTGELKKGVYASRYHQRRTVVSIPLPWILRMSRLREYSSTWG